MSPDCGRANSIAHRFSFRIRPFSNSGNERLLEFFEAAAGAVEEVAPGDDSGPVLRGGGEVEMAGSSHTLWTIFRVELSKCLAGPTLAANSGVQSSMRRLGRWAVVAGSDPGLVCG